MKDILCAANWKLNKGPQETLLYFNEFLESVDPAAQKRFIFFTPAINLPATHEALHNTQVGWGPQNVYCESQGAFTGENSAEVIAKLGASHALVGHSERRQIFGETDSLIAKKFHHIQTQNMVPILCLGETLEQREEGQTFTLIEKQLREGISQADNGKEFIVAYEPVWAIGTGKVASPAQAEEAHACLRKVLTEVIGAERAKGTAILYGGSVKPENAKELSEQTNIDGFLVGGASLNVPSFVEIYKESSK